MYILISGGLGNQLFQFVFANYVNTKYQKNTYLIDCTSFAKKKRKWELHNVKVKKYEIPRLFIIFIYYLSQLNIGVYKKFNFIFMNFFFFEDKIVKLPNKAPFVFHGYWQDIVYFKNNETYIRNKIINNIKKYRVLFNNFKINKSRKNVYVAIHIRRDDYFSSQNKIHSICNNLWYLKALNKLKLNIRNIKPIIFSDDINYVRSRLNINGYIWRSSSPESNFCDLAIMSMCDHFIISNSTFSWWSAWLSQNRDKKVVVPKLWMKNLKTSSLNFIPKNWIFL